MIPSLASRLSKLTPDWQSLTSLKLDPHEGSFYYRELRDMGLAEERRELLPRGHGERNFYRLTRGGRS